MTDFKKVPEISLPPKLSKRNNMYTIPAGTVTWGSTGGEKKMAAIVDALCLGGGIRVEKPSPGCNDFLAATLPELCREILRDNRMSPGVGILGTVDRAMGTGDFQSIMQNVANLAIAEGFSEAEETFELWTSEISAKDFNAISLVSMAGIDGLLPVTEHGEILNGYMADKGETLTMGAAGRIYPITRRAIVNDEQGAIISTFKAAGKRAKAYEGDLVYALLASNPVMNEDSQQLFSAAHGNQATVVGIPSAATMDNMDSLFGAQTDLKGQALNVPIRYIIAPRGMKGSIDSFLSTIQYVSGGGDLLNNTWGGGRVVPVYETRLNGAPNTWYAAGPKGTSIVRAHLVGQELPYTEVKDLWKFDAIGLKIRHDVGIGVADWRALASNP